MSGSGEKTQYFKEIELLFEGSISVNYFKAFLHQEELPNFIDFWFACHGYYTNFHKVSFSKRTLLAKGIFDAYIDSEDKSVILNPVERTALKDLIFYSKRKNAPSKDCFMKHQGDVECIIVLQLYKKFQKTNLYDELLLDATFLTQLARKTHKENLNFGKMTCPMEDSSQLFNIPQSNNSSSCATSNFTFPRQHTKNRQVKHLPHQFENNLVALSPGRPNSLISDYRHHNQKIAPFSASLSSKNKHQIPNYPSNLSSSSVDLNNNNINQCNRYSYYSKPYLFEVKKKSDSLSVMSDPHSKELSGFVTKTEVTATAVTVTSTKSSCILPSSSSLHYPSQSVVHSTSHDVRNLASTNPLAFVSKLNFKLNKYIEDKISQQELTGENLIFEYYNYDRAVNESTIDEAFSTTESKSQTKFSTSDFLQTSFAQNLIQQYQEQEQREDSANQILRRHIEKVWPSSESDPKFYEEASVPKFYETIFYLPNDPVPYRKKWHYSTLAVDNRHADLRLKHFKDFIFANTCLLQTVPASTSCDPQFRFFFKQSCSDVEEGIIYDEVCDDDSPVLLFNDKIHAKIEFK